MAKSKVPVIPDDTGGSVPLDPVARSQSKIMDAIEESLTLGRAGTVAAALTQAPATIASRPSRAPDDQVQKAMAAAARAILPSSLDRKALSGTSVQGTALDKLAAEATQTVGQLYTSPSRQVLDQIGKPATPHFAAVTPAPSTIRMDPAPEPTTPFRLHGEIITSAADIGQKVRDARRKMGMTQQRFADLAGVGRRFLVELERGKPSLEIDRVLAVCKAAGLRLGFIG